METSCEESVWQRDVGHEGLDGFNDADMRESSSSA